MRKWLNQEMIRSLCAGALLAIELLLFADLAVVYQGGVMSLSVAALLWLVLTAALGLGFRGKAKQIMRMVLVIPAVLMVVLAVGYFGWSTFRTNAGYQTVDAGKNQLFGDRKVMLVVPHQDDDLNILGGTLEEYVRYGSELYPVFVTNGDYAGLTETRYQETVNVFASMGVPEENVIFLGYGDGWKEGGPHIYNAPSGQVMESHIGRTETYGTQIHSAYREGRAYTIDNLTEDLKDVILKHRPDVIFCSDYDHHIDHKAVTLLFDKVMGMLLKEHPDYTPVVYKAYAYGTAWEAEPDYYADNILSTTNLFEEPYNQKPVVYRWEDRGRFPVAAETLSRSLFGSGAYARLAMYYSQGAQLMADRVINGDRVAWQRHTNSLCLHAGITVSSGQAEFLNDFMLIDNCSLVEEGRQPYDGVWTPKREDTEKTAAVNLNKVSDVSVIVLYDHPSEKHNVKNACITFDNGTVLETGALDAGGAATSILVDQKDVSAFTITLLETEGELAGLSEIEAFETEPEPDGVFLKLTDGDGNFLYDYLTAPDGAAEIHIYTHGDLPELTEHNYHIGTDNVSVRTVLEDGVVKVFCPAGERFALNVTCTDAGVSDSIMVRNPGKLTRLWQNLWQGMETEVYAWYSSGTWNRLLLPTTLEKISYVLRHM